MADTKASALPEISQAEDDVMFYVVDFSDKTDGADGSSRVISKANLIGNAKTEIETIELTGGGGEFDFGPALSGGIIPQGYKRLILEGSVWATSGTNSNVSMWINNDLSISAYFAKMAAHYASTTDWEATYTDTPQIGQVPGVAVAGYSTAFVCRIETYASASIRKTIRTEFGQVRSESDLMVGGSMVLWDGTAPVTRLQLRADTHPAPSLLGIMTLYGEG